MCWVCQQSPVFGSLSLWEDGLMVIFFILILHSKYLSRHFTFLSESLTRKLWGNVKTHTDAHTHTYISYHYQCLHSMGKLYESTVKTCFWFLVVLSVPLNAASVQARFTFINGPQPIPPRPPVWSTLITNGRLFLLPSSLSLRLTVSLPPPPLSLPRLGTLKRRQSGTD